MNNNYYKKYLKYKIKYNNLLKGGDREIDYDYDLYNIEHFYLEYLDTNDEIKDMIERGENLEDFINDLYVPNYEYFIYIPDSSIQRIIEDDIEKTPKTLKDIKYLIYIYILYPEKLNDYLREKAENAHKVYFNTLKEKYINSHKRYKAPVLSNLTDNNQNITKNIREFEFLTDYGKYKKYLYYIRQIFNYKKRLNELNKRNEKLLELINYREQETQETQETKKIKKEIQDNTAEYNSIVHDKFKEIFYTLQSYNLLP